MTRALILALVVVAAAGCGPSDPISRVLSDAQAFADDVCTRCPAFISGATTELQCRAAIEMQQLTETEEGCVRDVYSRHQAELDAWYDCYIPVAERFTQCVSEAIATCPPPTSATQPCTETFTGALDACPDLSTATTNELAACNTP